MKARRKIRATNGSLLRTLQDDFESFSKSRKAIARYLIDLAEREGKRVDDSHIVDGRPTQQEIADSIGTSRETVSRIFSEFKKRGVLRMSGSRLYLKSAFFQEVNRDR